MQGFDREDVAAKAIQMKAARGGVNQAKILDNLMRTDHILARNVLDLIQEYYTEERIINITHDRMTGEQEQLVLNQMTPEGEIVNDLTIGEYDIVITNVPDADTLEDSQFQQALSMREAGIQIPDEVLIENSRLLRRNDIVKQMREAQESPEAQQQAELQNQMQQAELQKMQAEAMQKQADAGKKQADAQKTAVESQNNPAEIEMQKLQMAFEKMQMEMQMKMEQLQQEMEMKQQQAAVDINIKEAQANQELELKQREMSLKEQQASRDAMLKRVQAQDKITQQRETHAVKVEQMKQPKPPKGAK
jgi:hypothetical protein